MYRPILTLMTLTTLLLSLAPWAGQSALAAIACTPAAIQGIVPSDTTIVSATPIAAPAYCNIFGYVTTTNPGPNQVNFQLGLPTAWNGRFLFVGNGGFAGSLTSNVLSVVIGVSFGLATALTDTGHQGASVFDGSWALNNLAKQDDWLLRAVHVSTVASKAIIQAFYGGIGTSYFFGCSTGGRQGLVQAQQYPEDFDGIIAGAPALGNQFAGFNWNAHHLTASPESYIPLDKLTLVDAAVLENCDGRDGVIYGLIQDPRKCTFNPSRLRCKQGNDSDCLTAKQVKTLKAIYAGASTEDGEQLYAGFTKSDPGGPNGWARWITGFQPPNALGTAQPWVAPAFPPLQFLLQDQFLKYFVFSDPNYNSLTFDLNNADDRTQLAAVINRGGAAATNPDLSAFINRGGKLLLYHGWSDPALSPLETVKYYKDVVHTMGGGFERTQESVRLFMVPGMRHCIGGPGPSVFNQVAPVVRWVLTGVAPDQIIATRYQNDDPTTGIVTRTMPLCPYPEVAVFTGGGINVASTWVCQRHANQPLSPGPDE